MSHRLNSFLKGLVIGALCAAALTPALFSQTSKSQNTGREVLLAGEVLQYKVKWNFLRLGTIIVRTMRDTSSPDPTRFKLQMIVQSNPDLMVVNVREVNESIVNSTDLMTLRYHGKHRSGDDVNDIDFTYDPGQRCATCSEVERRSHAVHYADTLRDVPGFVEGASLLFFSRSRLHCGKAVTVPTMVSGKLYSTTLDFTGPVEDTEVEGIDLPVRSRKYTGSADWKGGTSAGLSGSFTGWMSDDTAAVPLRAEMQVLVGSITIELERWIRPGWVPPAALRAASR